MSRPPSTSRLLDAFDRWKVDYYAVTVGGVPWHKRDSAGAWSDLKGIGDHHTATSAKLADLPNVLALLAKGRKGLPGPLCHFAPDPRGRLALIGWGNANHFGSGDADVYRAVLSENYGANPPYPNRDSVDGNERFYGFEVIHPGNSSPYPRAQIECLVRANAAICEIHGWSAKSVIQHGEWTNRKPDMSFAGGPRKSGPAIREQVALALKVGPDRYSYPATKAAEEDDMDAYDVWAYKRKGQENNKAEPQAIGYLRGAYLKTVQIQGELRGLSTAIDALAKLVGTGRDVDVQALAAAVKQAAKEGSEEGAAAALEDAVVGVLVPGPKPEA